MASKPEDAHMAKRRKHGLKHREIAGEFGKSRQTVGRRLKGHKEAEGKEPLRVGYNHMGSAV